MTVEQVRNYLNKIDFNVQWADGEKDAIDALTAKEKNSIEPVHLQQALQDTCLKVDGSSNMNFSSLLQAFGQHVQVIEGSWELKLVSPDAPNWIKKMVDKPKDNDLAYFIQKISQFINYNVAKGYGAKSNLVDVVSADAVFGQQTKRALDGLKYWVEHKNDKTTFLSIQDLNKLKDDNKLPEGIEYIDGDFVAKDGYERIDKYGSNYAVRKVDVTGNKSQDILLNNQSNNQNESSVINKPEKVYLNDADTTDEALARADSLRQRIPFANYREMQNKGFIDDKGNVVDPARYERVDPTDSLNFAVKQKPDAVYLKNTGWKEKIEKEGSRIYTYYEKDINGDGKIDKVTKDFALLIQKYGNPFDKNVPLEFSYGLTNHVNYHSSGLTLTGFGLDLVANKDIVKYFLPYIYGKSLAGVDKYVQMRSGKIVSLYKTQVVGHDIPSSTQKLRADKGQIFLDMYPNITQVYDSTSGFISIPKDPEKRRSLVYAQGRLVDTTKENDPLQKALYEELRSIVSAKSSATNLYKRGNIELINNNNTISFHSYEQDTKATKIGDTYVIDGISSKSISYPADNLGEFVRTLNFINFVKSEFLFHPQNSKYDIVIKNDGGLRLDDFWRHTHGKFTMTYTNILTADTIKSKFPSLAKRTNALLEYFNTIKNG